MKKIYFLGTCSTSMGIIKETGISDKEFDMQDIKTQKITPEQLDELAGLAGSYEALFSRRAIKYREMNLNKKSLSENDFRRLILEEYTFLKRPVVMINNNLFVGSEQKTIDRLKLHMNKSSKT